jgi:hypothetical protein
MNGQLVGPDPGLQQLITPQGSVPAPNMPQPPQQQGMGPSPPGTLGAVQQQMAPGNPLVEQYIQTVQALEQQLAPLKMPVQPPRPGPGLLESLGTFGIANLKHIADENTRREQNYVAVKNNQAVSLKAAAMAQHMVDAQAVSGMNNARLSLAYQKYITDLQEKLAQQAHQQITDAYRFETHPAPKDPNEATTLRALGFGPSERFPGVWDRAASGGGGAGGAGAAPSPQLTRDPAGGWVDPNTPVGRALGNVATPANQPRPGELPEDTARRIIRQNKPIAGQAQKDVTSIDQSIADANEILQLAQDPDVQKWMGPAMGRIAKGAYTGGISINPKVSRYIQKVEFLRASAVGPLLHGSRNPQVWKQIQAHLPMTSDQPALALDKLKGLADLYSKNRDILLKDAMATPGDLSATTETTTTTTPPTTLRGTAPTPSTQPTSLDALLKKHGY